MSHQAHFAQAIAEQRQAELVAAAAHYRLVRLARTAVRGRGTTPSAPVAAAPRDSWWDGSAASTPPPEPEVGVTAPFLLSRSASARPDTSSAMQPGRSDAMTEGIKTIIIPVRDLTAAKALYGRP